MRCKVEDAVQKGPQKSLHVLSQELNSTSAGRAYLGEPELSYSGVVSRIEILLEDKQRSCMLSTSVERP